MPPRIIQFLVDVSRSLETDEDALLDSAIFSIHPFLTDRWWDSPRIYGDLFRRMDFGVRRKSRQPYHARIVELLEEIRSTGLRTVINQARWMGDWVHFLQPLFGTSSGANQSGPN